MSNFNPIDHPRETQTGKFVEKTHSAPQSTLSGTEKTATLVDRVLSERRELLLQRGFLPASYGPATSGTPVEREGIEAWWSDARLRSEISMDDTKRHPVMPDDYTIAETTGRALSGKRRTHRMLYKSDEIALRMPSASAIRRFANEMQGATFDVPISAEGPAGNPVSGHVRVTKHGPGNYSVSAINMPPAAQERVAEAVNAILEARRPSFALKDAQRVGGLVKLAQERRANAGAPMVEIERSMWMRGAGYNKESGEMTINLKGRTYGYKVPQSVFDTVVHAASPGAAYNNLVKGKYDSHAVTECTKCKNWHAKDAQHSCMKHKSPSGIVTPYMTTVKAYILGSRK
jgi:hypothetical protein